MWTLPFCELQPMGRAVGHVPVGGAVQLRTILMLRRTEEVMFDNKSKVFEHFLSSVLCQVSFICTHTAHTHIYIFIFHTNYTSRSANSPILQRTETSNVYFTSGTFEQELTCIGLYSAP